MNQLATLQQRDPRRADAVVPREFVGKARVLQTRIIENAVAVEKAAELLIGPLRPTERFTPVPKKDRLAWVAESWKRLPRGLSRLRSVVSFEKNRLQIAEIRLFPVEVLGGSELADWTENGIGLGVYELLCAPPAALAEKQMMLAVLGQHSLARAYQRIARPRSDERVLADIFSLVTGALETTSNGEVQIKAASGGAWIGTKSPESGIIIRTYLAQRGRR